MRTKKVASLLMALVFCFAVASVAFARWEACSYCGGRIRLYDSFQDYVRTEYERCPDDPSQIDRLRIYKVRDCYACEDCGLDSWIDTYEVEYRYHEHD